jgi:hypothetical protein
MRARRLLSSIFVVGAMGALLAAGGKLAPSTGLTMAERAQAFLESLPEAQRTQATFDYNDAERLNWHFIPKPRKGVPLKELEGEALQAAQRLIASGLSEIGYSQALDVMSLEEVLYLLEGGERPERRQRRDPKQYFLSIFGEPGPTGTWGFRVEGHHLSLNYSIADGKVVASTPEFFGANPSSIAAGPERTKRVLAAEEDIARQLLHLLTPEQRKAAIVDATAPNDLRGGGKPQPDSTRAVGLPASRLTADQRALLSGLLEEYLKNMPADVSAARRDRINSAGLENVSFGWWGGTELNEPHYYRVQGPTFLIEFNNTQNSANHVHSYWRDMSGDFNVAIERP